MKRPPQPSLMLHGKVEVEPLLGDRPERPLGIPVVAVADTNADPSKVEYPIPGNDDAIKGLQLLLDYFVAAINEGKAKKEEN